MGLQETRYRPYEQCSLAKHRCKHICKPLQANPQTKVCKRASTSPTREKLFFKISFPSKIFKTATAQPTHNDQNTNLTMTAKPLSHLTSTTGQTERQLVTAVLRNGGCIASYDSFVVGSSAVLRLNFCAEKPPLRKAAKRYRIWSIKFTVPKNGVSKSPSGRLTD